MPSQLSGRRGRRDNDQNDDDCNNGPGEPGGGDAEVVVGGVRPIDGRGTNPDNPEFGATGSALLRLAEAGFADGIGEMVTDRPDARVVSNIVVDQEGSEPNAAGASDFMWVWGQFLDHDLDLTRQGNTEPANIRVPTGDPDFDPDGTGTVELPFFRGTVLAGTGTDDRQPARVCQHHYWIHRRFDGLRLGRGAGGEPARRGRQDYRRRRGQSGDRRQWPYPHRRRSGRRKSGPAVDAHGVRARAQPAG